MKQKRYALQHLQHPYSHRLQFPNINFLKKSVVALAYLNLFFEEIKMELFITPNSSSQAQGVPMMLLKYTRVQKHKAQRLHKLVNAQPM